MQYQVHDGTADDTVQIVTNWTQMKSWESNTPKKPMYMVSFKEAVPFCEVDGPLRFEATGVHVRLLEGGGGGCSGLGKGLASVTPAFSCPCVCFRETGVFIQLCRRRESTFVEGDLGGIGWVTNFSPLLGTMAVGACPEGAPW